jgi:Gas vesicle synthesis protein GvpL/GvpF
MSQTQTIRNHGSATRVTCRCHAARPGDRAAGNVVWVYAITDDLDPGQLLGLTGVGGEPVHTVTETGLSAVVGSVDAAIFGETSLPGLLADPASIEAVGRAHHDVVARIASGGSVVPLRLATIYRDDLTVRALLAERYAELTFLLQSFQGTEEWGVKVHMESWPDSSGDDPCAPSFSGPAFSGPAFSGPAFSGPAFSGPDGVPVRQPRWQQAEACADKIDRALNGIAIATRRHPAPYPQFDDIEGWLVLNSVYLLDTERAAEFGGLVQRLTEEHAGLRADVTGPWPPYSFVDRHEV